MTCSPHYSLVPKDVGENLLFRRSLLEECGRNPESAAQVKTMCAEDMLFYVNAFGWTYDPRQKVKRAPFVTYTGFQDEAMLTLQASIEDGQDVAMPKSRDMGASWMGLTVFEWFWHFQAFMSFLLVSRNESLVDSRGNPKALFWKIDFLHQNQPRWLLPTGRWLDHKDPNRKLLHMENADNGSVISGESTTGDAGRGDRRTAMFIDEHAAFDVDAGFKVLRSTRDTTDCRIFNSTPQGQNNAFHEVVENTGATVLRLHWSSHPEKSRGLYSTDAATGEVVLLDEFRGPVLVRRKGKAPKTVMFPEGYPFELNRKDLKVRSPWYDYQCSRCVSAQEIAQELDIDFAGSAFQFFVPSFIDALVARDARPPLLRGDLEYNRESLEPTRFVEHPEGLLDLWIPLGPGGKPARDLEFVAGSDISAGVGASNSVTSVANRDTGEKIARLRGPEVLPERFAELTIALWKWFNGAFAIWDATGPTGTVFTQRVIAEGYGNIYYRRDEERVTRKVSEKPGYFLNGKARNVLLQKYRGALDDGRFVNRSERGLKECLQFVKKPDGSVEHSAAANSQDPSGAKTAHGDEVIADALTNIGVYERQEKKKAEAPKEPVGSLAWRRSRRDAAMSQRFEDALGVGWQG